MHRRADERKGADLPAFPSVSGRAKEEARGQEGDVDRRRGLFDRFRHRLVLHLRFHDD